jgi:hypothetical protein
MKPIIGECTRAGIGKPTAGRYVDASGLVCSFTGGRARANMLQQYD